MEASILSAGLSAGAFPETRLYFRVGVYIMTCWWEKLRGDRSRFGRCPWGCGSSSGTTRGSFSLQLRHPLSRHSDSQAGSQEKFSTSEPAGRIVSGWVSESLQGKKKALVLGGRNKGQVWVGMDSVGCGSSISQTTRKRYHGKRKSSR